MEVDQLVILGCKEGQHGEHTRFSFCLIYLRLDTGEPATWKCQQVQAKMPQEKPALLPKDQEEKGKLARQKRFRQQPLYSSQLVHRKNYGSTQYSKAQWRADISTLTGIRRRLNPPTRLVTEKPKRGAGISSLLGVNDTHPAIVSGDDVGSPDFTLSRTRK